jgi:hypothetical protein
MIGTDLWVYLDDDDNDGSGSSITPYNTFRPWTYRSADRTLGFEVLTAVSTKMAVFWVVAPCSLVEVY